jgi:hypothetical protein
MLISYHYDILKNSFDNEKCYFDELKDFKYITTELLYNGLYYPDIPCNDIVYTNNNQVKYLNYNTCKIPINLLFLLNESSNGLKETVQSHRGRQAIGHSMTFDPDLTVFDIRQKILRRLEILYMLALNDNSLLNKCQNKECVNKCYTSNTFMFTSYYDCIKPEPNIFWLGQILHCVQDSYSRVHTLRQLPIKKEKYISVKEGGHISEKESNIPEFKLIKIIGDKLDEIELQDIKIDNNIQEYLKTIINNKKYHKIIDKNPNDISHIFKLILFFKNQKKTIINLFNGKDKLPSEKNKNNNKSDYENYPYIMTFRYVDHQQNCGHIFHMSYDTKTKTEEAGFAEFMIDNCKYILNLYKEHILNIKAGKIDIKSCINEMITYIAQNVFPILDIYKNNKSAIKCNLHPHCECKLELDKVYELYNQTIKQTYDQTGGYYKKYLKYKIKYFELKKMV